MCYSRVCCGYHSYQTLAYCHKRSSQKLHLVSNLHKCWQDSDAAQEPLFDLTSQAGLQSGPKARSLM